LQINNAYTKRSKWMSINLEKMEEGCESKKSTEKRRRLLKIKERQATLLLGLILTAFIASWLPFFVSGFSNRLMITCLGNVCTRSV
jgi:hypothetical protein